MAHQLNRERNVVKDQKVAQEIASAKRSGGQAQFHSRARFDDQRTFKCILSAALTQHRFQTYKQWLLSYALC
jgi:hypothetical protein